MRESNQRIAIVVAVIGVIGTLGAAFIANWDKIFARAPQPPPKVESRPSAEPILNLSGPWHDINYPSNRSQITQDGNKVRFTSSGVVLDGRGVLPNGTSFESSGSGEITGQRYTNEYNARYLNGDTSTGSCSGTVSPDGTRMEVFCNDSLLGSFPVTAIRH